MKRWFPEQCTASTESDSWFGKQMEVMSTTVAQVIVEKASKPGHKKRQKQGFSLNWGNALDNVGNSKL